MDSRGPISIDAVRAYSEKFGRKQTEECLRRLGMLQQFYNAYSLPLGKELLSEINAEMVRLSGKVLTDPDSKDDDKNMFRAYSTIGQAWARKINDYEKIVRDIRDEHRVS